jgi:hypothetical protein
MRMDYSFSSEGIELSGGYFLGASGIAYHNALIYLYSTNSPSFTLKICLRL